MKSQELLEKVYSLIEVDAEKALNLGRMNLGVLKSQDEIDSLNWAMGYALVTLRQYDEAEKIWRDIFERTGNHRALHQVGMVYREAGNLQKAFDVYSQEANYVADDDWVSKCANLYELSYCNHLMGDSVEAKAYFKKYEGIKSDDLIERACFFRLKGDLLKSENTEQSRQAYQISLEYFQSTSDEYGIKEIEQRLRELSNVMA